MLGAGAAFAFPGHDGHVRPDLRPQFGATSRPSILFAYPVASFLGIFGVLYAGRLSDRFGRPPGAAHRHRAVPPVPCPFFACGVRATCCWSPRLLPGPAVPGLTYGPLAAFISEQFGTKARYTGASLGYQLATLLGGGFTPGILATLARNSGGNITPVAMFLIAMGVISTIAVLAIREGRHHDLNTVEH